MTETYENRVADIARRASSMRKTLVDPFRNDDGSFIMPTTRGEQERRNKILESAISDSHYSMTENGKMIAAIHARTLQGYEQKYGRLPSDDLLASCHKAVENALMLSTHKKDAGGVFESAEMMSTTQGIMMRDRLVSLILPVWLQTITANMVTFMPGEFNQSEFFRIKRVAGSKFGSFIKGQEIDYNFSGLYSVMDRREELGKGDGSTKDFTFTSTTKYGSAYPFKQKRTRIYADRVLVAEDNGSGVIAGSFTLGGSPCVVSGTVEYPTGVVSVNFSVAPASEMELHVGFDVDIEANPELIPRVDHRMESRTLYPHESAIAGNATVQAIWALRREIGQDIENLTMQALRNILAADKDRKHLNDMWFHAKDVVEWNRTCSESLTLREHYESLQAALLEADTKLMSGNGVSGLVGIVGGTSAVNIFRYLPNPYFQPAPGYRSSAQPHYVGRVFGQFDLYCNPQMEDPWSCLCFARGADYGQTAYVAGDAVPALTFRHPILGDLVSKGTMWDLAYRDMQPFDGASYLCKLIFTDA